MIVGNPLNASDKETNPSVRAANYAYSMRTLHWNSIHTHTQTHAESVRSSRARIYTRQHHQYTISFSGRPRSIAAAAARRERAGCCGLAK